MPTATLTSKGQLTVPLAVRRAMGLQAGTKVDFVQAGDGFRLVPLHKEPSGLKGRFAGRVAKAVSILAMDEAIAAQASARHAGRRP